MRLESGRYVCWMMPHTTLSSTRITILLSRRHDVQNTHKVRSTWGSKKKRNKKETCTNRLSIPTFLELRFYRGKWTLHDASVGCCDVAAACIRPRWAGYSYTARTTCFHRYATFFRTYRSSGQHLHISNTSIRWCRNLSDTGMAGMRTKVLIKAVPLKITDRQSRKSCILCVAATVVTRVTYASQGPRRNAATIGAPQGPAIILFDFCKNNKVPSLLT
ncbi:hypothetical protein LX36DRAFT_180680 [Colletotrichum falcatum]|nr:hypothetical protein LX36DRAFT_180680 [Colletotrichum falcatum]